MPEEPWSTAPTESKVVSLEDLHGPLNRERLADLFMAGLTSTDIGLIYGMDRSRISQVARNWGQDSRSLRAACRSLSVLRPDLADEFHADEPDRIPQRGPHELTLGSGARVAWRCRECTHIWRTTVASRALRASGCPKCARTRSRENALRDRARTPALTLVRPDLAEEFVRNISVPWRSAETTPSGCHDRINWRCAAGHEWVATARQRVKYRTHCPACRAGLHSSRLEYEVAELLMEATGLHVSIGHEEPRSDRAAAEKIDLKVEELDLLIDLDAYRWHRSPSAIDRDTKKLLRLAEHRYVRIRPTKLGALRGATGEPLPGQLVVDIEAETDAWAWAVAVLSVVGEHLGGISEDAVLDLSDEAKAEALGRAGQRWTTLNRGERRRSLLSEHPEIAAEFVAVPRRTGLTAADVAPAGDDRVLWRCSSCGHEWVARTRNRTVLGTGCPPCSFRAAGRRWARPQPGQSFADRHPQLIPYFVENLAHPGVDLSQLRPNSADKCRWFCPHCGRLWETTPHALNRTPSQGCRRCSGSRSSAGRQARGA